MRRKNQRTGRRVLDETEIGTMFRPGLIDELIERSRTMVPFEADCNDLSAEEEARLDSWVEGYCASGHDPDYRGSDRG